MADPPDFGFTDDEWDKLKDRVRPFLISAARGQRPVTYTDVADFIKDPRRIRNKSEAMDELLGDISRAEHAHGRPLLSAVVVVRNKDGSLGRPGVGFDQLAHDLGANVDEDDEAFWKAELLRVCKYDWS